GEFLPIFDKRLSEPGHVAMAENPTHGGDESLLLAVALAVLSLQVFHDRLAHGQPNRFFRVKGAHSFNRVSIGRQIASSRSADSVQQTCDAHFLESLAGKCTSFGRVRRCGLNYTTI